MHPFDMNHKLDDRRGERHYEQVCVGPSSALSMEAAELKKCLNFSVGALKRRILARPVDFNRCALACWHGFACFTTALKRLSSNVV